MRQALNSSFFTIDPFLDCYLGINKRNVQELLAQSSSEETPGENIIDVFRVPKRGQNDKTSARSD